MSKCTRHKIDNFRDAVFLAGNEETKSNTSNTTNMYIYLLIIVTMTH